MDMDIIGRIPAQEVKIKIKRKLIKKYSLNKGSILIQLIPNQVEKRNKVLNVWFRSGIDVQHRRIKFKDLIDSIID
jgi:hypothetical protein